MLEEYGDDLAVIFVESQGASPAQAELFAYEKGWMGRGALWSKEAPASTGLGYLPSFILLDVDGRVLLKGNTAAMKSDIADAVKQQIDAARDLPEGFDRDLRKAWKALIEGDYVEAAERLAEEAAEGGELATQAESLRLRLDARLAAELDTARRRFESGHFVDARDRVERLSAALEDAEQVEALAERARQLAELAAALADPALESEFEADEQFQKLYAKVCEDGVEDQRKALERFRDKHPGTRAAERAAHLLSLLG